MATSLTQKSNKVDLTKYQKDPVGFCRDILGDNFTPDVEAVMMSVVNTTTTLAKSANGTGKSFSSARIAIWFLLCYSDSQVFITAAPPEKNINLILWKQIRLIVRKHPHLFAGYKVTADKNIEDKNDPTHFLSAVTIPSAGSDEDKETRFSGKHAPHMLFILDEGNGIPDPVYKGIEGCMSGGYVLRILIMFNPRQMVGPVWIKERDQEGVVITISAFDHPNVVSGENKIPGAVTRDVTVERINRWSRPLNADEQVDDECFLLPNFLVGCTAQRGDKSWYDPLPAGYRFVFEPSFWYMVLGQYPSQSTSQLISRAWVKLARKRWDDHVEKFGEVPPKNVRPILGLDVSEVGVDSNMVCLRYGGYVARLEGWASPDVVATGIRAAGIYVETGCIRAFVDGNGVGSGSASTMARMGCNSVAIKTQKSPTRVTDMGAFAKLRDQLYWSVREWLRTAPDAMLPPDDELLEELLVPTYSSPDGKLKINSKEDMRESLKRSPDRLDALALTFTQDSDRLLHLYEHVIVADIDGDQVRLIDIDNSTKIRTVIESFSLSEIIDYGFIACSAEREGWAITRLWFTPNGRIIIPEIWRTDEDDIKLVISKITEAHRNRSFRAVGIFADIFPIVRSIWYAAEETLYAETGELGLPDLIPIKMADREERQLIIRDTAREKDIGIFERVIKQENIWNQFSNCETIPDDSRDSLAGVITILNREVY